MRETIKIRCKNNKNKLEIAIGSTLSDIFSISGVEMEHGPVVAKVNNRVTGLGLRLYHNSDVEYLDLCSSSGSRTYTRTLFFVLCKAVHDLFSTGSVVIDIPVSNGYFCDLQIGRAITPKDVDAVRRRMQEIIDANIPIRRHECTTEEAVKVFREKGTDSKVKLLLSTGDTDKFPKI